MKHPARVPSQLSESVREQLNAYALAATAAGVGMLALAQPAEGKIVYTEAQIDCSKLCHLDVNNDGRPDFILSNGPGSGTSCGYTTALLVSGASFGESHSYRNAVVGKRKSYQRADLGATRWCPYQNGNRESGPRHGAPGSTFLQQLDNFSMAVG